ncbi:transcription antitermination factor NusB [bacterium]|nr:transcription antitermination factor NusB [bacterium]
MNDQPKKEDSTKHQASRRKARKRLFEICFEAEFQRPDDLNSFVHERCTNPIDTDPTDPEGNINAHFKGENLAFLMKMTALTIENSPVLDKVLTNYPWEWSYDRIGLPERVVLRIALAELIFTDTPIKIVINEALDIAKAYGEAEANKFVNGILGSIVNDLEKIRKEVLPSSG